MDLFGTAINIPEGWTVSQVGDRCFCARHAQPDGSVTLVCHTILPGILLMDISLDCRRLPVSSPFDAMPRSINWCSQGRCEVDLGDRGAVVVDEGCLCLSSSSARDFSYPTGSYRGFEYLIDPQQLDDATKSMLHEVGVSAEVFDSRLFSPNRTLTITPDDELLELVRRIEGELACAEPRATRLVLATFDLLAHLVERDFEAVPLSGKYLQRSQRDMAELVYEHLMRATAPVADLDPLAEQLGVSEASLRSYFSKVYGESPASFVRRRCLSHAKELLESTSQSVGSIALTCGYANQSKFAAAFRRAFGTSPLEARRRSRVAASTGADHTA